MQRPGDPADRDRGRGRAEALAAGAVVRGAPVRVAELTGRPGDVTFLHPHLLHAAAPNHAGGPRMMVTGQVVRFGP